MYQVKRLISTAGATAALALSLAAPVAANPITNTDDHSMTVNGNCSAIIVSHVDQDQSNRTDQDQLSLDVLNNKPETNGNSQTATVDQTQSSSINFAPDCSVNNVTNVTQQAAAVTTVAAAPAAAPQVAAPKGAVHAGAGGGVSTASNLTSLVGLAGSIGTVGLGVALRKRSFEL